MAKLARRTLLIVAAIIFSSFSLQSQVRVQNLSVSTLKEAFDLINSGAVTGNIEIKIDSNVVETERAVLMASKVGSANYTSVTIYPTAVCSITGDIPTALIELRDADYVTIDGRINRTGNTNALTLYNAQTTNSAVIWLSRPATNSNGARGNTIRNCNIRGNSSTAASVYGINTGSVTSMVTGAAGMDSLKIINNSFARLGFGIRAYGVAGGLLKDVVISNNNFGNNAKDGDGCYYGAQLYYAERATVSNNKVSVTNTTVLYSLQFGNVKNSLVENNIIKNSNVTSLYGINFATSCDSNIINNITVEDNAVGGMYALQISTSKNNSISNINIKNNIATGTIYGIYVSASNNISNNFTKIYVDDNQSSSLTGQAFGMYFTAANNSTVTNSRVSNLKAGGNVYGIQVNASTSFLVKDNIINNLVSFNPTTTMYTAAGIYISGSATTSIGNMIVNNSISGIFDGTNKTNKFYISAGIVLYGGASHQVYYNSVNMYGNSLGTNNEPGYNAALTFSQASIPSCNIRNNTFVNTMSKNVAGSKSYAIYMAGAGNWSGATLDYNNYYVDGDYGVLAGNDATDYLTIGALRAAKDDQNLNSVTLNPVYNSNDNLRLYMGSPLAGLGVNIAGYDKDMLGVSRSSITPTIGAYENIGDFDLPVINYMPLSNTISLANRNFLATIVDRQGVNTTNFQPRIYFRKSTNANTFAGNTPSADGWKFTEGTKIGSTFEFTIDYSLLGNVAPGAKIEYFVVAQDVATTPNVAYTSAKFAIEPVSVELTAANFPVSVSETEYLIAPALSGKLQVGQGQTYTTLTAPGGAFELINSSVLVGNLDIEITSDIVESGEIALEQCTTEGGVWNVKIYPTGNYTISGNTSPALIELRDADRVTIDGRVNATGDQIGLTMRNSSLAGTVIWLTRNTAATSNGAKNNTIKYCRIIGGSPTANTSFGIALGGKYNLLSEAAGNDNNIIENNKIYRAYYGIRAAGAWGNEGYMQSLTVRNNDFGNNATAGDGHYNAVYVIYGNNSLIENNTVKINSSAAIYPISNNYSVNTIIRGNLIAGNVSGSSFYAISDNYSDYSQISNNELEGNAVTTLYGLYTSNTNNTLIQNNRVSDNSATSSAYLLYASNSKSVSAIDNKFIGNSSTSSINVIQFLYTTNPIIKNNLIKNISAGSTLNGISLMGTTVNKASNALIENNVIQNLASNGTSYANCIGIYIQSNSDSARIFNNAISGIFQKYGTSDANYLLSGIRLQSCPGHKLYNNTVNMWGEDFTADEKPGTSAAIFVYDAAASKLDIRNNVFVNKISNATGGKSYALLISNAGSLTETTIDYNDYYVAGNQGVIAKIAATEIENMQQLRTATNQDVYSVSLAPEFNSELDVMPFYGSPLALLGTALPEITTDLLGNARLQTTPTLGAYEIVGDLVAPVISLEPLKNTSSVANREFSATITDRSGIETSYGFAPRVYYRKKSNSNVYIDNSSATDGWKYTSAIGTTTDFDFTIDVSNIYGGVAVGDEIEYFVVAQDASNNHPTGYSSGEFAEIPASVQLVAANFPVTRVKTSYQITMGVQGTFQVGEGRQFASLTGEDGAFAFLNQRVLSGNVNLEITSDLVETGLIPLKEIISDGAGAAFYINIYPTVAATISGSTTQALISLENTKRFNIDGRINRTGNTNSLTIQNSSTVGTGLWLKRTASGDGCETGTIRNVNFVGAEAGTSYYNMFLFVASGASSFSAQGGHRDISVLYNSFKRSYYAVRFYGSSMAPNENIRVRFNTFGNNAAINDGLYYPINLYYANNAIVSHNNISINFLNGGCIAVDVNSTPEIMVYDNVIENCVIAANTTFYAMRVNNSKDAQIFNNSLNNVSAGYAQLLYLSQTENAIVSNNSFRNLSLKSNTWFVYLTQGSGAIITDNILENASGAATFYGLMAQTSNQATYNNNIIKNVTATGDVFSTYIYGSQDAIIRNNRFENIAGVGSVYGLHSDYSSKNVLFDNNNVANISSSGNIYGAYVSNSKVVRILNNSIDNIRQVSGSVTNMSDGIFITQNSDSVYVINNTVTGVYAASNRVTKEHIPSGIKINGGKDKGHKIYFNSINMFGNSTATTPATGASSAFTLASDAISNIDVRNNIFNNKMVGASTNYKAYSVYISSVAALAGAMLDYNNYYVSGANAKFGCLAGNDIDSLPNWAGATGMDHRSISVEPSFNNDRNLSPFDGSPVIGAGTPISNVLYDKIGAVRDTAKPSIGAYEFAGDFDPPQITFTPLPNTSEIISRTLQAEIYDLNGVNNTNNPPRIYFKKKNNQNVFVDNSPGTDGWKYTIGTGSGFNYVFTIDYNLISGGVEAGDEIEYFIVAQDNSPLSLVRASSGDFNAPITSTALTASHFPVQFIDHSYRIAMPFAGIVDVGIGKVYTSLTNIGGLFEALNSGILVGNLQIRITSDLEESGIVPLLQAETENNAKYSISIYPNGKHTIIGLSPTATIQLQDADNVTIDGRINRTGNTNALTITNEQAGGAVIWVTRGSAANSDGAKNVTVRNCIIIGPSSSASCYGIVASGPTFSSAVNGVDSLKILYNDIRRSYYGVRVTAADGSELIATQVVGNKFGNGGEPGDATYYAFYSQYLRYARIDSNDINVANTGSIYAIYCNYSNQISIQNNKVQGATISTLYAYYLHNTLNSVISGNTLSNSSAHVLYGYYSTRSNLCTYSGNKIENVSITSETYPFYSFSGTDNVYSDNIISNVTNSAATTMYIMQIYNEPRNQIKNNVISNISSAGTLAGIYLNATSATPSSFVTISGNRIENLFRYTPSFSTFMTGILIGASSDNALVANNLITGIYDISTLTDPAYIPSGIRLSGSQNTSLLHNTVSLSGKSPSFGINNSAALVITGTAFLGLNSKNNVFLNTITSDSLASKSYAIYVAGTGISGVSLDYNNYYVDGANAQFAYMGGEIQDLDEWVNMSLQDMNSISANPEFVGLGDYRPLTTSPLIGAGTPVAGVSTDMLGAARSTTAPTIGAYENGMVIGVPILRQPANGSTNVSLAPTLVWDSVMNATGYGVQVATDANFAMLVYNGPAIGLNHTLASLNHSTQYFWRVRALKGTEQGDWSAVWSFTTEQGVATQTFALVNGWNMISANVVPENTSMSSILNSLSGNLQQAKNVYGQLYAPPFTNTLTGWNKYHAYQIRMTTSAQFQLAGLPIVPEATPITLNQLGWYWLPYYRTSSMPTATALASISGKYLQIKSITGEVYQPPFATTLANLDPNKGYMIRLTASNGTLTYPANTVIKQSTSNTPILEPKVFVRENNVTGKNAFIALDLNANEGDEVGVFTRDGMLVGSSVWQNALRGVVIWGDDEFTSEKDGASEGEELIVKVWNSSNKNIGEVSQITLNDMTTNAKEYTLRYETDAVYFLKGNVEATSSTLTVTPQPATTEVMLNLGRASEGEVEVKLFNQAGQLMLTASESAANGIIKLNTSDLPSGVYQAMINVDGNVQTARIVIVR